jgi:hypothetical protein
MIGSLLLFLTLGVFELGRLVHMNYRLLTAVSIATRVAETDAGYDSIESAIRAKYSPGEQGALTIVVEEIEIDDLPYMRINARFALRLLIPGLDLFGGNVVNVNARQFIPMR